MPYVTTVEQAGIQRGEAIILLALLQEKFGPDTVDAYRERVTAADGLSSVPPLPLPFGLSVSGARADRISNFYVAWGLVALAMLVALRFLMGVLASPPYPAALEGVSRWTMPSGSPTGQPTARLLANL